MRTSINVELRPEWMEQGTRQYVKAIVTYRGRCWLAVYAESNRGFPSADQVRQDFAAERQATRGAMRNFIPYVC